MTPDKPVICIGIDFSPCGEVALESGARLAKDLGASVLLVHALQEVKAGQGIAGGHLQRDLLQAKAEVQEDEVIDLTTEWAKRVHDLGVAVETYAEEGDPAVILTEQAERHHAAVIVVGSHGRSGWRRALLGSTAEDVIRHSERPVVVVPCKG